MIRVRPATHRISALLVFALALAGFGPVPHALAETSLQKEPIYQLRIYEIFEGNKQAFHERFRDHAVRIMAKYDFKIVAMWESATNERTEFVYVLEWPDAGTMKDRWSRFMADQEWADIKKKTAAAHGRLVGTIEERVLRLTSYSPPLVTRPSAGLRTSGTSTTAAANTMLVNQKRSL
jgi:hypothetical protein